MNVDRTAEREMLQTTGAIEAAWRKRRWALESALSMEAKAAAGYRANPILGDAPWPVSEYTAKVDAAALDLAQFTLDMTGGGH